jgi:hypothetical protein
MPGLLSSLTALGTLSTRHVLVWVVQLMLFLLIVVVHMGPVVLRLAVNGGTAPTGYNLIAKLRVEHAVRVETERLSLELSRQGEDQYEDVWSAGKGRFVWPTPEEIGAMSAVRAESKGESHGSSVDPESRAEGGPPGVEPFEPASILEHQLSQWLHHVDADQPTTAMIYLAEDADTTGVEAATEKVIRAYGLAVAERLPVVRGSWFRRLRLTMRAWAGSEDAKALLADLEYAARVRIVLEPAAAVDEKKGNAVAALITSLQGQETAVVMIGSIMVLKMNGVLVVRDLTPHELAYMARNPGLIRDPETLLAELESVTPHIGPRGLQDRAGGAATLSSGEAPDG